MPQAQESPLREVGIRHRDKSAGFRTRAGFFKTFDAGPDAMSFLDIAFPYPVDMLQGDYWLPAAASPKNRLWVEIAPNTDLALLAPTAGIQNAVAAGDTEIVVNAMAKAALAGFLKHDGLTQTEEVFVRLTSVPADPTDFTALRKMRWDAENSKLKSADGAALGLTAAAGDKIFATLRWEDGTYMAPGEYVEIGSETEGASGLPAGLKLRIILLNEDTVARDVGFNLTYLHD